MIALSTRLELACPKSIYSKNIFDPNKPTAIYTCKCMLILFAYNKVDSTRKDYMIQITQIFTNDFLKRNTPYLLEKNTIYEEVKIKQCQIKLAYLIYINTMITYI